MDPALQTLQYFKPSATSPKGPREFISIRSLSYQKQIPNAKLEEDCNF